MADGTMMTTSQTLTSPISADAQARWDEFVEHTKAWVQGRGVCDRCNGLEPLRSTCHECEGLGRKLVYERPTSFGYIDFDNVLGLLADVVAEFEGRGGLEYLPERSRKLVEELRDGLGARLMDLSNRLQDLDRDLVEVKQANVNSHWPKAEPRHEELMARIDGDIDRERAAESESWKAWDVERQRSAPFFEGDAPCGDCDVMPAGTVCTTCRGTRKHPGLPLDGAAIADTAAAAQQKVREAVGAVADLAAHVEVARRNAAVSPVVPKLMRRLMGVGPKLSLAALLTREIETAADPISAE